MGTQSFASVENLNGGSGNDEFMFNNGASGYDKISGGSGAGTNTLDYSAVTSAAVAITLSTTPGAGTAAKMTGFNGIESFIGGSSATYKDTLTGARCGRDVEPRRGQARNAQHGDRQLCLRGDRAPHGRVGRRPVPGLWRRQRVRHDQRRHGPRHGHPRLLHGDWADHDELGDSHGAGLTTFSGFEYLLGTPDPDDTLIGPNAVNAWSLTGSGVGNIGGTTSFSAFESLTGGSSTDTFVFSGAAAFLAINGGSGTDTFDYSAVTSSITVDLQNRTAPLLSGQFTAVECFIGTSASDGDILIGPNATSTWTLNDQTTAATLSTVETTKFKGFEELRGGTGQIRSDSVTARSAFQRSTEVWGRTRSTTRQLRLPSESI